LCSDRKRTIADLPRHSLATKVLVGVEWSFNFYRSPSIVMMGGNVAPIKPDYGNEPARGGPGARVEYQYMDVPAAQKVFNSGVPLYVMLHMPRRQKSSWLQKSMI